MGWTEVWQYSKLVKCPLENQYFASYIAIAAVYFERICMVKMPRFETSCSETGVKTLVTETGQQLPPS